MKRVLITAGVAILALSVAYAQKEISPLLSTQNADNATFYPRNTYPSGPFKPMGVIYTTSAAVATGAGAGEQILGTYSLPANALYTAGNRLHIHAVFHCGSSGSNKTEKLYFGASVIATATAGTNNKNVVLDLDVVKTGASTQIVTGTGIVDTTPITPYLNAGGDTDTAAIVIKATGTAADGANEIILEDFVVTYET